MCECSLYCPKLYCPKLYCAGLSWTSRAGSLSILEVSNKLWLPERSIVPAADASSLLCAGTGLGRYPMAPMSTPKTECLHVQGEFFSFLRARYIYLLTPSPLSSPFVRLHRFLPSIKPPHPTLPSSSIPPPHHRLRCPAFLPPFTTRNTHYIHCVLYILQVFTCKDPAIHLL